MNNAGQITDVNPRFAIAGGEIAVDCTGFVVDPNGEVDCLVAGEPSDVVAASSRRVLARVPDDVDGTVDLVLTSGTDASDPFEIVLGRLIAENMHIVANPAIDPKDNSIVLTRSGSRGQELPHTMYRLETDGYLDELPVEIANPTSAAFDRDGRLYVSNRADGVVCRIERNEDALPYAGSLGVATGIAFDSSGIMFVGDRTGAIFRIDGPDSSRQFATLEPSVAAYHLAFGPDGRLFVTAPGLASYDGVYAIGTDGTVATYFRGFGRPQGLAFDREGNLYVAACHRGLHGIVKIEAGGGSAKTIVAGNNIVGLCFSRAGEMIIATSDSVYSVPMGIYGTLLD
ncbi:MAG: gluconolaconase [Acidobacteriota bacterium]